MIFAPHRSARTPSGGFTLLEILLATAVSAIIILALQTVFFAALRLRNTTTQMTQRNVPLQRAVSIIEKDLAGIMLPGGVLSGLFQTESGSMLDVGSSGDRVGPDFYTTSAQIDNRTPFSEVQRVSYSLVDSGDAARGKTLVREVSRNLLPALTDEAEQQELLHGVAEAEFLYFDGTSWVDYWDSSESSTLPSAIKLRLTMVGDPNFSTSQQSSTEIVVPIMATTTTSATAAAAASDS